MNYIEKGLAFATDTKKVIVEQNGSKYAPVLYKELFGNKKAVIVTDDSIYKIIGEQVNEYFKTASINLAQPFIYTDPNLFAEWTYLEQLEKYLKEQNAIAVGVGAGVINDLCKLASEHLGQRYIIIATSASMDGYASCGASITYKGNKQTFNCKAPLGVIFDSTVAAGASIAQNASGYADLLSNITADADWLWANFLNGRQIVEPIYNMLQIELRELIKIPDKVANKNLSALNQLGVGLLLSGFAMQGCGSSRPASGMEHLFAHYWDMDNLTYNNRVVSHGFKVAIGTLVSATCLEYLLNQDFTQLDIKTIVNKWPSWEEQQEQIKEVFATRPLHLSKALIESKDKYITKEELTNQLLILKTNWPKIKQTLSKNFIPYSVIYDCLKRVGAPYTPSMIGVSNAYLAEVFKGLPYMRYRFTNIDVIMRTGLMPNVENYLFGKGGRWEV